MKLYINDERIDNNTLTAKGEILSEVKERLDKEIIYKIYLDDVEVSLTYFKGNNLKVTELETIKFITKKTEILIEETLLKAREYLPKLKKGLLETADLFSKDNIEGASRKLEQCLRGIEWYTEIMNKILTLREDDKKNEKGKKLLDRFNKKMTGALIALQNKNYQSLADILEVEIVEYLNKLNHINDNLINNE